VVLLLITASVSAAPSAFPDPGPATVGTGPQSFPVIDARPADAQLLELLDAQTAPTDFVVLDGPAQIPPTSVEDSLTMLSSELTAADPLHELFTEPLVIPSDSMRIAEVTPPAQPPILVPSLDTSFFSIPQLNVLLVLAIAVVLYRYGAKALRLHR
jgi:hypothetical protein